VTSILEDRNGNFWVGTNLFGLHRFDRTLEKFKRYTPDEQNPRSIGSTDISTVFEDREGRLWIGTGKGLEWYDPHSDNFIHLYETGPLTGYGILQDNSANLWLALEKGIGKFDPATKSLRIFDKQDGLSSDAVYSLYKSPSTGYFYAATDKGVTVFHPDSLLMNQRPPPIVFTAFKRYSQTEKRGSYIEEKGISEKPSLKLSYQDKILIFEFAALSFSKPTKNQYAYRLEGFNDQWIHLGAKREATFTNLAPGSYTLRVKGSNGDGVWNEEGASLKIIITPPWWRTWWAYALYVILVISGLYSIYRFQLKRKLEYAETLRLKELDTVKTRLYTNITHEFRTPLTVINGMVEQIRDNPRRWLEEGLEMIRRNSDNLLRLVNQILSLRKLEAGDLPVRMVQGDVIHYLKYIVESFHSFAGAKGVAIHFLAGEEEFRMDYDPEKLLSIASNLLSNAVKFTLNGGEVFFSVSLEGQDAESLVMRVQDTGTGIAPEDIPFIFERFFQADDSATRRGEGSGIGLALTRELVKLLKGEIGIESKLGHGTEFTVRLPVSREAATAAEEDKPGIRRQAQSFLPIGAKSQPSAETGATSTGKPLALLIEDNADVITYLKAGIEGAYSIATAHNGAQGVEKALRLVPDIIISDVMMPGKDGFDVCRILKQDERTSHIPIILLTARADQDAKVEGLERGADAYLAKPFDKAELLVRMRKLLELRQRLQAHYAALAGQGEKDVAPERKEPEDSFVLRIRRIVENHLSDPDFTVEQLCRAAFVGHSQLHRKLTALTGYSAVRFIRLVRLAKAKELLPDRKLTIAEIAFSCGFNDPVYFTRVFKTEFGRTPSGQ
jgi:signal transduction histidine kinase/DNA-binding response OmpR family regulator